MKRRRRRLTSPLSELSPPPPVSVQIWVSVMPIAPPPSRSRWTRVFSTSRGSAASFYPVQIKQNIFLKNPIWMTSSVVCEGQTTEYTRLWRCYHGRAILLLFLYTTIHVVSCVMCWAYFLRFWIMKATQQLLDVICFQPWMLCVYFFPLHVTEMSSHQFLGRYVCIRWLFQPLKRAATNLRFILRGNFFLYRSKNADFSLKRLFVCLCYTDLVQLFKGPVCDSS